MYTYFLLTALPACRERVLRFAPLITSLQISQFAWGTVINVYAAVSYFTPSVGCAIRPQILQIGAIMYLLYGGLFGYPGDTKNPNGKLRLLYEAAPIAFLLEAAGGLAVGGDGERILEIEPTNVHQRVPCFFGSADDVKEMRSYFK